MWHNSSNSDLLAELRQLINDFLATITGQFEGYNNSLTILDTCLAMIEQEHTTDIATTKSALATIEHAATVKQLEADIKNAMASVGNAFLNAKMDEWKL